jgi:transposase
MFEAKDILTLLGIPGTKIKSFDTVDDKDEATIFVELEDIRGFCPRCGSTLIGVKDYYNVHINNSLIKHRHLTVEIRVRRYECQKCGKTFKQEYDFVEKGSSISNAVKGAIIDDLKERITAAQIARDHNVSKMTVMRIFDKCILPQLPLKLSEIICIDEFCYKHSNSKFGKYPCVITNPLTGKIIDIIESRWKDVLIDYFNKVKVSERYAVKYFVSDMNETYRQIKKIFFKDAIHIADRFHVVKAFNEAITVIRNRILKQEVYYDEKEYRYLKKNWKIFLKDRNELSKQKYVDKWGVVTDPTAALDRCLAKYPDLYYAYWTKEEFRYQTRKLMYYHKAEEIVNFYENKLLHSEIDEMSKIGKTFTNWKREIINGLTQNPYSIKISNAIAEATNNQMQTLIDMCYGLPKFHRMRKRVLYINRNQKD